MSLSLRRASVACKTAVMLTEKKRNGGGVDTAPGSLRPVSEGVQVNQLLHPNSTSLDVATPRAAQTLEFLNNGISL